MSAMASQITGLEIVYSIVHSGADQRTHQSSASLAFVRGIHWWPVNSPHKGPVTRKMFPFDDVIMNKKCFVRGRYEGQGQVIPIDSVECNKRMIKNIPLIIVHTLRKLSLMMSFVAASFSTCIYDSSNEHIVGQFNTEITRRSAGFELFVWYKTQITICL